MARYHGSPPPIGFSSEIPETLMVLRRERGFEDRCSRDGVEKGTSWAAKGRFVLLAISGGGAGSLVCAGEELLCLGGEVVTTKQSGCKIPSAEEGWSDGELPDPLLLLLLPGNDLARTREG